MKNLQKTLFALLISISLSLTPLSLFYAEETQPSDLIKISTAEQLAKIGKDDKYPLDGSYILTNDIDLSAYKNWTPIGEYPNPESYFCGNFDGNNFKIKNLKIASDIDNQGLFGCIGIKVLPSTVATVQNSTYSQPNYADYTPTIKNLTLENCNVKGNDCVGIICGLGLRCLIENCTVSGTVNGYSNVGAIAGKAIKINKCKAIAKVRGTKKISGISDCNNVSDCYFEGEVIGDEYVSGIVSHDTGVNIKNSSFKGKIIGKNYVGGVISDVMLGLIENCSVSATIEAEQYVGGLIGHKSSVTPIHVKNSYFTGKITGEKYVGGLAGQLLLSGTYSSNFSNPLGASSNETINYSSEINNFYSVATIVGKEFVGGFCGHLDGEYSTISNVYLSNTISATKDFGAFVGQSAAKFDDKQKNIYYNKDLSKSADATEMSIGKTTNELYSIFAKDAESWVSSTYCLPQLAAFANSTDESIKADSLKSVGGDKAIKSAYKVGLVINSKKALIGDKLTQIDPKNDKVTAIIIDGRTLVPARFIAEAFNADVKWTQETKEIVITTKDSIVIKMVLGSKSYTVNGENKTLDVPLQSVEGRTLVPLRAIVEAMNKKLLWDSDKKLIIISDIEITSKDDVNNVMAKIKD